MAATPLQILLEDAFVDVVVGATPTTGPFSFDFPFFSEADDIKVKRTDDATGVVTTLAVTTDYTVSGVAVSGGFQGGTITLTSSDSDATLTIYRDISIKRTDWFPASGPFDITTLNQTFARIFAIAQEINESIDRGLKLDITEAGTELTLPDLAERSSKFLAFDASGLPIASDAVGAGVVVTSFAETLLDDATAAAMRTTLGLGTAAVLNAGTSADNVPQRDSNAILNGEWIKTVVNKTSATTLVAADVGALVHCDTSGGAFTTTLPSSGMVDGATFSFECDGANAATIARSGTDTIDSDFTSIDLNHGDKINLTYDGGNWLITGGPYAITAQQTESTGGTPSVSRPSWVDTTRDWLVLEFWGAGGSGAINSATFFAGGGGGGAYIAMLLKAGEVADAATLTVGVGGAAVTSAGSGNAGGDTKVTTTTLGDVVAGGGGAGNNNASQNNSDGTPGSATVKSTGINTVIGLFDLRSENGGRGGEGNNASGSGIDGGSTLLSGAGGGGGAYDAAPGPTAAGTSDFGGGDGGAGAYDTTDGTDGTAPGGGGGGAETAASTSGAGADGKAVLTWIRWHGGQNNRPNIQDFLLHNY